MARRSRRSIKTVALVTLGLAAFLSSGLASVGTASSGTTYIEAAVPKPPPIPR